MLATDGRHDDGLHAYWAGPALVLPASSGLAGGLFYGPPKRPVDPRGGS
jgi:hypothetical protein